MPDYDLYRLSPRSFEQLVQAVSLKLLGNGATSWGDGPDGGREITFEGSSNYPSSTAPWDGSITVQAKFKQRQSSPATEATWARSQLEAEFREYLRPKNQRRRPDYYIFATNVTLSPTVGGGREKITSLINEYSERLGLIGFAIWDYDQIRTVLDSDASIRQAFGAWVTAGDVLAAALETIGSKSQDFYQTMVNFLQKEVLSEQYVKLEQAGHAAEHRIPLARVFVDLPFVQSEEQRVRQPGGDAADRGILRYLLPAAALKSENPSDLWSRRSYLEGDSNSTLQSRIVLVGGPGQGKTTLGQFFCQLHRAAILKSVPQDLLAPEVQAAISDVETQCVSENLELPCAVRFPVRIVLSEFATALASPNTVVTSLLGYIAQRIYHRTSRGVSSDELRGWIRSFPWLIVLDGLDEVPASSNRDDVLQAISEFIVDSKQVSGDVFILTTTRPQGYNQEFSPKYYTHLELEALSSARAMHYAKRFVGSRYQNDADRLEKVLGRLSRAAENSATSYLLRSPLQVTILCALVDKFGQPPQERWNLFREYYEVIYAREVERDIPAASILRDYKAHIDTIHRRVGLVLQLESERRGSTDARLSSDQFSYIVLGQLGEEGYTGDALTDLSDKISVAAADRLVFLVGVQADAVGFEIRSLQEYMAAEAIIDGSDDIVRDRLRELAPIVAWRNAILFAVGKCFVTRQYLRDTIYAVCAELNEAAHDNLSNIVLSGSQLALDILEDGPARRQPKYSLMFVRLALRSMDVQGEQQLRSIAPRLTGVYKPLFEEIFQAEIRTRLESQEFERSLGAWAVLLALVSSGVVWASMMASKYWPENYWQQWRLLSLPVGDPRNDWLVEQGVRFFRSHPLPRNGAYAGRSLLKPTWLKAATSILFDSTMPGQRDRAPLVVRGQSTGISLTFIPVGKMSDAQTMARDLAEFPDPPYGWAPFIQGAAFAETPNKSTLAKLIRAYSSEPSEIFVHWASQFLPWIAVITLFHRESVENLEQVARQIEASQFGDTDTWTSQQTHWIRDGVTESDLLASDAELIVTPEGTMVFPIAAANEEHHSNPHSDELITLWSNLETAKLRRRVAAWILDPVGPRPNESALRAVVPALRVTLAREAVEFWHFSSDILPDMLGSALTYSAEWENLLSYFGSNVIFLRHTREYPFLEQLEGAIARRPYDVGLLRVFCHFETTSEARRIPKQVLQAMMTNEETKPYACCIKLSRLDWHRQELSSLLEAIGSHKEDSPLIRNVIHAVRNESNNPLAKLLLAEISRLWHSNRQVQFDVMRIAADWLARRTSRLLQPDVWADLALPLSLGRVMTRLTNNRVA